MSTPIGRRPVPVLLFGAALLRLAVLRRDVGAPSATEEVLLDAVAGGERLGVPLALLSEPWMALLAALDRVTGEATVTLVNAPALPPDPDPLFRAAQVLATVLGVWAVGLVAGAAQRLGGVRAAWLAGALIALSPLALRQCGSVGPGSFHLLVASALVYAVSRLRDGASAPTHVLAGACGGLALASGGGGAGLLAGLAAGRVSVWGWGAAAAVAGVLAPGAVVALLGLPPGSAGAAGGPASAIATGLLVLLGAIGGPALALAVPGKVGALGWRGETAAAGRAVVFATAGAFLVALFRVGPAPAALAATLPGLAVLAGLAFAGLGSARERNDVTRRPWLIPAVAAVTLAGVVVGTGPVLSAYLKPPPAQQIADWLRTNAATGATILSEEDALPVPTAEGVARMTSLADSGLVSRVRANRYIGDGRTFSVLPLPPPTSVVLDRALFYDPNLAEAFGFLVLRDLPEDEAPSPEAPLELVATRRLFHDYFRQAWTLHARVGSAAIGDEPLSLYGRNPDFELDREVLARIARLLTGDALTQRREESDVFTDWAEKAGYALLVSGDPERARPFLGMVTERDPDRIEARYQFARVLSLLGEYELAKSELLTGMNLDPFHGGIHLHLGAILEQEGDGTGALIEYQAAVMNLEDPVPARARLGALFHRLGFPEAARDQLMELEAAAPNADVTAALRAILQGP